MDPVVIYRTFNQAEVQLIRSRLEGAGIEAEVQNEQSASNLAGVGEFRIVVPGESAEDAQTLLRDIRS